MTPEQQIERLEQQLLDIQALALRQEAAIAALLSLLRPLGKILEHLEKIQDSAQAAPAPPAADAESFVDIAFLQRRKELAHTLLLNMPDKALAGRLLELLEKPSLNFPIDFD